MSVHHRRFAAAKRTAAQKRGFRSRLKLTLTWLTIVAALSLFTAVVANGARSARPDYAGAAKYLRHDRPMIVVQSSDTREVCSVTESQLALLETQYDVGWMTVVSSGVAMDFVTVSGANDHDLRMLLGYVDCKLVKEKHVFYLPFDAQLS